MPVVDKPKILAFDTASRRGSVALLEGTELQAELKLNHLQNHSSKLIRSIDFLLEGLGWTLQNLDLVAVGTGPGSFTGIRIGIATGLGLAQALSVPFAGISGMEALAFQTTLEDGCVGVLLNAQRSQVYYAEYKKHGGKMSEIKKPSLMFLSDLQNETRNRRIYLIGETDLCVEKGLKISKSGWPRAVETNLYLSVGIGRRSLYVKRRWKSGDYIQCEPLYIRPPDALKKKNRAG
jgi:tRNA threonylcarbamoyladenosine biosynthesis protein TsaB